MKKFSTSFRGYNKEEVNNFVEKTATEFSKIFEKLKKRDTELASLKIELELTKRRLCELEEKNKLSKFNKDDYSYEISNSIIENAKFNASKIINDALIDAEKMELKTEQLKKNIIIFKKRIKATLNTELQIIEDIDNINLDE